MEKGFLDIAKYLVEHGARLKDRNERSTAYLGTKQSYHQNINELFKTLIEQGNFDINSPIGWNGESLLLKCIDDLEMMKYLIEKGANLNQPDVNGQTVLHHLAKSAKNYPTIKFLVEHGANPSIRDKYGNTAKKIAKNAKMWGTYYLENIIEYLKEKENEQKKKAEVPLTAFDLAKRRNREEKERKTKADEGPETWDDRGHHPE